MYFLGSASGFYFVYDFCLYDKMSSEMAYFLRYVPLFVGVLISTSVVFAPTGQLKKISVLKSLYKWVSKYISKQTMTGAMILHKVNQI